MKFKLLSFPLVGVVLGLGLTGSACAVVPASESESPVAIDAEASRLDGQRYVEYRVGINIAASPERIWELLVDAPAYPQWNSTIISVDGTIAAGETIKLKAKIDPKRTFKLEVTTFEPHSRLVWGDGGRAFSGVRTFTLTPREDGSTDVTMAEVLRGSMMGMIEASLPDFRPPFNDFAADLKSAAEAT